MNSKTMMMALALGAAGIMTTAAEAAAVNWRAMVTISPNGTCCGDDSIVRYGAGSFDMEADQYAVLYHYNAAPSWYVVVYDDYASASEKQKYEMGTKRNPAIVVYGDALFTTSQMLNLHAAVDNDCKDDKSIEAWFSISPLPTPEPTSGLLVLLGLVGLVLKRKEVA